MEPIIAKYKSTVGSNFKLSPSLHKKTVTVNSNVKRVDDFLSRRLERSDLGTEVGTINYVKGSNVFFIRTKALQSHSYLLQISSESVVNIHPASFKDFNLKSGDVIISKDSNIGEVIILDQDYPNFMLSGALYRLPIVEKKYYLLAFLKHEFFRNQLDTLVPRGATIRHAGTKFLNCQIPLPNFKINETFIYIENLMKLIIEVEKEIKVKFKFINDIIVEELQANQSSNYYNFSQPKFSEIHSSNRLDTGIYSSTFRNTDFLIRNYSNGYFHIDKENLKSGNTPDIRHIDSDPSLKYRWVTPTNCSDHGYLMIDERISMPVENNLNQNAMLLVNRTSKGGRGEYVGIASFYDLSIYGLGHHNQGIYRVFNYSDDDLIFMTCFMNIEMMRKYCSYMCVGSKMKELRANQFLSIPFPKFETKKKSYVVKAYNNGSANLLKKDCILSDSNFLKTIGIIQLETLLRQSKNALDKALNQIINDQEVTFDFFMVTIYLDVPN